VADYLVFGQTIGTITFRYCHQSALTCSAAPSTATSHRLLFGAMVKSPSVNHPCRSARQPIKVVVPALWYQLHACLDMRQTCQPVISRSTSQHPQKCKQRTCCGPLLHFEPAPKAFDGISAHQHPDSQLPWASTTLSSLNTPTTACTQPYIRNSVTTAGAAALTPQLATCRHLALGLRSGCHPCQASAHHPC
jgi:hypothetical protein